MKISVSIPIYDGKLQMQSVACLLTETQIASMVGDSLTVTFLPSCTNLAMGRNQLVKEFLNSDADRLVFLDADVTFEPGALVKLAHYPVDVVGGAYRLKQEQEEYPVAFLAGVPSEKESFGLLEVDMIPTGFMSLSRRVFETFRSHFPEREYEIGGVKNYCYFQIPYRDGALYTEDAYFCREWKALGGKIYLDPEMNLTHWQFNQPFPGHVGDWLRRRANHAPAQEKESA